MICSCSEQKAKDFDGFGKQDVITFSTGLMSEGLGEVAFSCAGRAVEEDMFSFLDKYTGGQVPDKAGVEFGVEGEVEALQGFIFLE